MSQLSPHRALESVAAERAPASETGRRQLVVTLLRTCLSRWGPSPRRDLLRYMRKIETGLGGQSLGVGDAIDDMVFLGEAMLLRSSVGPVVCPRPQFGVRVGDRVAVLGVPSSAAVGLPPGAAAAREAPLPSAHVRWLAAAELAVDLPVLDLPSWLGWSVPRSLLADDVSIATTPGQRDEFLREVWSRQEDRARHAGPAGADPSLEVLVAGPDQPMWRRRRGGIPLPDGVWLCTREFVGERRQPGLVLVHDGLPRRYTSLPGLAPWDAYAWLSWARGAAHRPREVIALNRDVLHPSVRLPRRLRARSLALCVEKLEGGAIRAAGVDAAQTLAESLAFLLGARVD